MSASLLAAALGGLGLLLLGMGMMTDGLKAAAGNALRDFLERSTRTRPRAALMGFFVTALVQSSSAVIVATLGFTNAGILRLRQAAWVVFGSNIGTTMTAWIVALVGLRIKVEIVALPLIGLGMLLRVVRPEARLGHVGVALAGFGLLFLGLGLLRDAFIDVADWIPIARLGTSGPLGIVLGVLAGALLTALIQSSSAALAIVLTASVTGVLTPLLGASLVIGANIGTTATSVLASIGATANARRLATVHVAEKVLTASVALCLLAPLWWLSETLSGGAERANISTGLALFHTVFNLLGMFLMVFLADPLLRRVERWIPQPELLSQKPRYIDDTVLDIPAMGLSALHSELKRVFKQLLGRGRQLINVAEEAPPESDLSTGALLTAIAEFGSRLGARSMPDAGAEQLLTLTTAREECQQLREVLVELERLPTEDVQAALSPELTETFLSLLRSGELKAMTDKQRNRQVKRARRLRRQYRTALLERIRSDSLSAAQATRYLHVIALLEAGMKHIARIAEVIYPEGDIAVGNAAPEARTDAAGGAVTAPANAG